MRSSQSLKNSQLQSIPFLDQLKLEKFIIKGDEWLVCAVECPFSRAEIVDYIAGEHQRRYGVSTRLVDAQSARSQSFFELSEVELLILEIDRNMPLDVPRLAAQRKLMGKKTFVIGKAPADMMACGLASAYAAKSSVIIREVKKAKANVRKDTFALIRQTMSSL